MTMASGRAVVLSEAFCGEKVKKSFCGFYCLNEEIMVQ